MTHYPPHQRGSQGMKQEIREEAVELNGNACMKREPKSSQHRGSGEELCHGDQRGEMVIWLLSANMSPLRIWAMASTGHLTAPNAQLRAKPVSI